MIDCFRRDHHRLFLLDGLGALLSAGLIAGLLIPRATTFGMPWQTLLLLAALALGLAVYSLSCYRVRPVRWPGFLKSIAVANLTYCLGTIAALIFYREQITTWGLAYFAGECVVILALAGLEFGASKNLSNTAADR